MRALLPNIGYVGVGFTMPKVLWPVFKQNRHLLHDLPALGAGVIQQWVKAKYGVRVLIIVVPHTFGAALNFNCHLHILVSAGGLQESQGRWISRIRFPKAPLMRMWKYAVITYLRKALKANVLKSDLQAKELTQMLETQYERDFWIVDVDYCKSKQHFLGYVARYVRRPPIAQRRFRKVTEREVEFLTKDKKLRRMVTTRYSIEQFLALWADQVPDRLSPCGSLFWFAGARHKESDLGCSVCSVGAGKATSSSKVELAEFASPVFWRRSAGRSQRPTDEMGPTEKTPAVEFSRGNFFVINSFTARGAASPLCPL
jgi:hypothetical protein